MALAERGWDIALHYNSSAAEAKASSEAICRVGVQCRTFCADLADPGQVQALLPGVVEAMGGCDLLVNNASIFDRGRLGETDLALYERTMAINLRAPLLLMRDLARCCATGHVINLLDTRIASSRATYFAYSISKKALAEATLMAARDLGPAIRVNGVCPGLVLEPTGEGPDYLERLAAKIPLAARGGVEDVVRAVLYLLDSPFVTGELLYVDGGEKLLS